MTNKENEEKRYAANKGIKKTSLIPLEKEDIIFVKAKKYHQRGEIIMAQGILPYQYEMEKSANNMTARAGLLLYLDLMKAMGLSRQIESEVRTRKDSQGWTDAQIIEALILLNQAGGECVEDIDQLESDPGFAHVLEKLYTHGMKRRKRRELTRRWRKEMKRRLPSRSAVFRYLSAYHNEEEEGERKPHKAFIPAANEQLKGLQKIIGVPVNFAQRHKVEKQATLDQDATLVETHKEESLACYKGYKAYQPLNTYWAEHDMIIHSEFRDGNVPAGYEQLRVLQAALETLPAEVEKVYMRSDTAGYQWDLLKYCAQGQNERFGVIEFAIGADVRKEFKQAALEVPEKEWKPIRKKVAGKWEDTGQEWAEVCYVPNKGAVSKKDPEYRYLATRELLKEQIDLEGMKSEQKELPFPTMEFGSKGKYKIYGIVTNRDLFGEDLILWYRQRCGKSEEAHAVMKEDLAGGKLPSGKFGANAAWWQIMILALNINQAMKRLVLGKSWEPKRMKAIRYHIINVAGQVIDLTRGLIVKISCAQRSWETLVSARAKIMKLAPVPGG